MSIFSLCDLLKEVVGVGKKALVRNNFIVAANFIGALVEEVVGDGKKGVIAEYSHSCSQLEMCQICVCVIS